MPTGSVVELRVQGRGSLRMCVRLHKWLWATAISLFGGCDAICHCTLLSW